MSNRDKWVYTPGKTFGSLYKGKNWSDANSDTWTDFPWKDFTSEEKKYVREIWNGYKKGTGGKGKLPKSDPRSNYWPVSEINPNLKFFGVNVRENVGKFLFFDLFNLAPTPGEYYGLGKKRLPKDYQFKNEIFNYEFYSNFLSVVNIFGSRKYSSNFAPNTRYFSEETQLLTDIRFNSNNDYYREMYTLPLRMGWDNMVVPYQREFKLSWMRQLVEYGVEARMGSFNADGAYDRSGNPIFTKVPNVGTNLIRVGNIDMLLRHRWNYKLALFYNWAQNEYDWAKDRWKKEYEFNKNYPSYLENKFPKAPIEYLNQILGGDNVLGKQDGRNEVRPFVSNIVLSLGVSGLDSTPDNNLQTFSDTLYKKHTIARGTSAFFRENITTIGIPPYFANDNDRKNYVVSGWVELPSLMPNSLDFAQPIRLPWPFVWKYIGMKGFYEALPSNDASGYLRQGSSLIEKFYKENPTLLNKPTLDDFQYDWRARLWHYRYDSIDIPDRELLFYLRLKYGVAKATKTRYMVHYPSIISQGVNFLDSLFDAIRIGTIIFLNVPIIVTQTDAGLAETLKAGIYAVYNSFIKGVDDLPKLVDSLIGGGLPSAEEYKELTNGGILDIDYKSYDGIVLEKNTKPGPLYYEMRSRYISSVQNEYGWNRFVPNQPITKKAPDDPGAKKQLTGKKEEIVDYSLKKGYYTFNGHGTDRIPWSVNTPYLRYKLSMSSDIKKNDLCLYPILYDNNNTTNFFIDGNDRYSSPEHKQSYNWSGSKVTEVPNNYKIFYHNHAANPTLEGKSLRVNGEFHPAIFSGKELQFMYEAVTYVLYGDTAKTKQKEIDFGARSGEPPSYKKYWQRAFTDRWDELSRRINMPLYNLKNAYSDGKERYANRGTVDIEQQVLQSHVTTLADYILWAAPTSEQYKKQSFTNNGLATFVEAFQRYRVSEKEESYLYENSYPMHALAKIIIDSEKSSLPLVPGFVHHRYISRKMNQKATDEYYGDGKLKSEGLGINFGSMNLENYLVTEGFSEEKRKLIVQNMVRALGGVDPDDTPDYFDNDEIEENGIDKGVLITLPRFVLGGRPKDDLGRDDDAWDSNWGDNPFQMINGKLVVGNLDKVIDMWAKQTSTGVRHNGKYVSAMEIMFWIRYRHGLAATPTERRIIHKLTTDSVDPVDVTFPHFLKYYYIDGKGKRHYFTGTTSDDEVEDGKLLPTEYLNGIPIVTSYYSPIIVDEYDLMCHDPLIEIQTAGQRWKDPENYERAAYTGFNSYYACDWPGATYVRGIRQSDASSLKSYTANFLEKSNYPKFDISSNSAMSTYHSNHYLMAHRMYRAIDRRQDVGYTSNGGILYTGFDYNYNDAECKKVLLASNIQSWFKAYKLTKEIDRYSEYINAGLDIPEGQPNSVLVVTSKVDGEEGTIEAYISGESIGSKKTSFRSIDSSPLSHQERMRIRPWFERLESSVGYEQPEMVAMCDDYSLGSKGCIPNYMYMRHMLLPEVFMYVSSEGENADGGFYSTKQVDNIKSAFHRGLVFWSRAGIETGTYIEIPNKEALLRAPGYEGAEYPVTADKILSGVALQAITLSMMSEEWKYSGNYKKDLSKLNRQTAYITWFTKYSPQKFIWNTSQKVFFSLIGAVGSCFYLTISSKLLKELPAGARTVLVEANIAARQAHGIHSFFHVAHNLKDFKTLFKGNTPLGDRIAWTKLFIDLYNTGVFGNDVPGGFKAESLLKVGILFGRDLAFAAIQKIIVKNVGQRISLGLAGRLIGSRVTTEVAARTILYSSLLTGGTALIIDAIVAIVAYAIDRLIEEWEINQQIEKIWALAHEANKLDYLEGPYIQSEGTVKIKKTPTGEIPILGKVYTDTKRAESERKVPQSSTYKLLNLQNMTQEELVKFIYEQNDLFYRSGGVLSKILKDIKKDSCECNFFMSIFDEENIPKDHREKLPPYKGHWLRRLINRRNVIDEAPVYEDIPMVFQAAQEPFAKVSYNLPLLNSRSTQVSDAQVQPGTNTSQNIRRSGYNGTRTTDSPFGLDTVCPRFWWPTLLVTPSTNICNYMAISGYYPESKAEFFEGCESKTIGGGISLRIRDDRGSIIDYYESLIGNFREANDAVQVVYSRTNQAGKVKISYHRYSANTATGLFYKGRPLNSTYLYTGTGDSDRNIKISRGEQIYTADGVHGPAPPHEREIISIFRKKYNIDVVLPAWWMKNLTKTYANVGIHNPYKYLDQLGQNRDKKVQRSNSSEAIDIGFLKGYTFTKTNCCSISEIAMGSIEDNESKPPTDEEVRSLAIKKAEVNYCEYVITLNTEVFKTKIINKCKGLDTADNSDETRSDFANSAPVPNSTPPPEDREKVEPPKEDGYQDPVDDEPGPDNNPRIPGCTNCEPIRSFVLDERKFAIEERVKRRSTYRRGYADWRFSIQTSFFNQISFSWINIDWLWGNGNTEQWRETRSTPLQPGKKVRV